MLIPIMFMAYVYVLGFVAVVGVNAARDPIDRPGGGWPAIALIAITWPVVLAIAIVVLFFEFLSNGGDL